MSLDTYYIEVLDNAVSVVILTKAKALEIYSEKYGINLNNSMGVGDGLSDIGFMNNCGFCACPANSQEKVKELVNEKHGLVSDKQGLDGALEAYEKAKEKGLEAVIFDKDGVLTVNNELSRGEEFREVLRKAGQEKNPYIILLTGSSFDQNTDFLEAYGFNHLHENPAYKKKPWAVMFNSGLQFYNVFDKETKSLCDIPDEMVAGINNLKNYVEKMIEKDIFGNFGIVGFTEDYEKGQNGRIYRPKKEAMATWNIPRYFKDGKTVYRGSEEAKRFSDALVKIITDFFDEKQYNYEIA
ncbi:HAD hydrolase family protein [Candidatus Woesearchaeota archaeon]|nr:HAD hydrolase family protein [Candidatus Woesearchaeota archaeon]